MLVSGPITCRVGDSVRIRATVNPSVDPHRIALHVSSGERVIVSIDVLVQSRLGHVVLAWKAQVVGFLWKSFSLSSSSKKIENPEPDETPNNGV